MVHFLLDWENKMVAKVASVGEKGGGKGAREEMKREKKRGNRLKTEIGETELAFGLRKKSLKANKPGPIVRAERRKRKKQRKGT